MAPIDALTREEIRSLQIIVTYLVNEFTDLPVVEAENEPANQSSLIRLAAKIESGELKKPDAG